MKNTGIDPSLSSGAFCVTKSGGRLRLICDRRPRNSQEHSIRKVPLPSPPRFCRILLPRSHAIKLSGRDLKDFYYNLEVDEKRWIKQAWGPRVPASWFENLDDTTLDDASDFESRWGADLDAIRAGVAGPEFPPGFLQPLARTLLMGDLNAVLAAQVAHFNLLERAGVTAGAGDLGASGSFPRGAVCGGHA